MKNITLFRGLGYDNKKGDSLTDIKNTLLNKGDSLREGTHSLMVPNIEHHNNSVDSIINELKNEDLNIERYAADKLCKYVCSDTIGADFYATRSFGNGIVVQINTDITRLIIDGRDFLYYAIPKIIRGGTSTNIKDIFEKAFGKKAGDYINKGVLLKEMPSNIHFRFVDHFCMDLDIINSNLNSDVLIKGRYNTRFKGAFGIIDGIRPEDIVDIIEPGSNINSNYNYVLSINDIG